MAGETSGRDGLENQAEIPRRNTGDGRDGFKSGGWELGL